MQFERKIYKRMMQWKEESQGKSALLIEGARRIGKSTIARRFAEKEYQDYLILDFAVERSDIKINFEENMGNLDEFFRNLFLLKGKELPVRKSVLIFDEIQMFPKARQAIKYLVADGRYDYIETGSLISIKKNTERILIPSEEEKLQMFPMDFEEYLWALQDRVTVPAMLNAFNQKKPLGDTVHREIMKKFRTYLAVGGMPQAVEVFTEGKSYQQIDAVKRRVLSLYEDDLASYDQEFRTHASTIFRTIPEQLSNHNSHFKMSMVDKNARFLQYEDAVKFIADSMMGNECINATQPETALEAYADRSNFKLYMGDTGLLVTAMLKGGNDDLYQSLICDRIGINEGMIMENAVAQMLRTSGHELYFHEYRYKSKASEAEHKYEIDFLTVRKRKVCPIEVKSSSYQRHESFDYFIKKYPIKVEDRFIIYTKDIAVKDGITFLPIYMTMFL
jgi:predicted AAA+ superfamily ATPase